MTVSLHWRAVGLLLALSSPVVAGQTPPAPASPSSRPAAAVRTLTLTGTYLLLPVKNGAKRRRMSMSVDGRVVRVFDIELADHQPDWWAFMDIRPFRGKQATLKVDSLEPGSRALQAVEPSDRLKGRWPLYDEPLRPQFHFSARRGWNNDPNGLVHDGRRYHLFFQHNPYGTRWANMHWGHAVSTDLLHWEEMPIALYPWVQAKGHCFSGSAVVDFNHSAGLPRGPDKTLVAIFTDTGCGEALAWSNDGGRTFTYYRHNPVVRHKGRDPKVIWYAPGKHWVMAVFDVHPRFGRNIAFYTSTDLKHWTEQSHLPGYFECPEIFELPVDGNPDQTRWVVYAADAKYAIGRFDGKTFTPEHRGKYQVHWGNYYASQTFNHSPDGRRIQIGWARIGLEGMPFNQFMSFPTQLTLRRTGQDIRLFSQPIAELARLHQQRHALDPTPLSPGQPATLPVCGRLFDIRATFRLDRAEQVGLVIGNQKVIYDRAKASLEGMPLKAADGRVAVQVLVDRPCIEVFGNAGRVNLIRPFRSDKPLTGIQAFATGGPARLEKMEVFTLKSIWKP